MLGLGNSIGGPDVFRDLNDVPSLQLWLKNGVGVAVGQWDDSSRKGRNITQAIAGDQAVESGGGLDFEEGDGDHYDFTPSIDVAKNQGFCVAWVMHSESNTLNTILSNTDKETIQIQNSNKLRIFANDDSDVTTQLHVAGAFTNVKMSLVLNRTAGGVWSLMKNGSYLSIAADGGGSSNSGDGDNIMGFTLDTVGAKNADEHFMDGKILELAVWDRALTVGEIADVDAYLVGIHSL